MAEDLTDYLLELGVRVRYLHSDIDTITRIELLRDLRLGEYDVLVGINLLREGLDLPEVQLVAILDADKTGFLRSASSLIQTMGRAARNVDGLVVLYADTITDAMRAAISETQRRRALQQAYNAEHGIDPTTIRKAVTDILASIRPAGAVAGTGPGRRRAGGAGPARAPARCARRGSPGATASGDAAWPAARGRHRRRHHGRRRDGRARPRSPSTSCNAWWCGSRRRCGWPPRSCATRRRRCCATRSPSCAWRWPRRPSRHAGRPGSPVAVPVPA